jgi:hypothetical protein
MPTQLTRIVLFNKQILQDSFAIFMYRSITLVKRALSWRDLHFTRLDILSNRLIWKKNQRNDYIRFSSDHWESRNSTSEESIFFISLDYLWHHPDIRNKEDITSKEKANLNKQIRKSCIVRKRKVFIWFISHKLSIIHLLLTNE